MALGLDRSRLGKHGGLLGRCESVELWLRGMSPISDFFASCSHRNSRGCVVLLTFELSNSVSSALRTGAGEEAQRDSSLCPGDLP